ncbi:putative phosphotransferase [Microlunatus endophyticus]|uniref:Phosphotransferase n=1 Tax=Microlunatus endophyticus TaxID=1716077 RepID=A0A917W9Y4_9ACTN|nr:aminoglycoside 3'-phosphotransferase [Microlunatus endophyticus]GGL82579.1 putative phosphotransferase [Microlunatus endophyticus]
MTDLPAFVGTLAAGAPITPVWDNELGGHTYRIDRPTGSEFVKWCPDHPEFDLELEAEKLTWAGKYVTVPPVIDHGRDSDSSSWLHTRGIPGETAVAPRWKAEPETAAKAIGTGLRALHDQLPVADCRWSWEVDDRAKLIKKPADLELIKQRPETDLIVVCHGDACSSNTLIAADGTFSGHVDFGSLGVADRWADLAIATYAIDWNYDPRFEDAMLQAYGIERDQDRIDYYRRLWDAT